MNDRRKLFCCISKFSDEIVKPSVNDWVFLWYIISDDYQNCKMMKGWIRKSPSHSSNPIDFSNIFILIKRTIYDMQIHDLVERSSTFIHVFRAQSISHADHFLLLWDKPIFLQQWRHDRKPTFKTLLTEVMAFCFSSEH